ncbi:DUF2141 domain-containing protein [Chlorobium limicola]|uniref:DUF2141 domain-containing protein n=1 Tax=Chlorobium limicola TaxID=1092 RepID=A0A101J6T0_CHLLI|nr:DUF2141 domain-containing protein [Chlorobium limicola]KUL21287.1 hypothetical protein ASB62_08185 [Chlorobium limicola]
MKKLLAGISSLFCLTILPAAYAETTPAAFPTAQSGCITVNIRELKKPEGMLGVLLYSSKQGFPDKPDRALARRVKKISGTEHEVRFENIPYGTYAVSVLHDENGNGKMDKKKIVIPKEGFGISNNPKIKLGPPSFSEAIFTLDRQETELTINMIYL